VHVDVKKLRRIPDGGGWRVLGRHESRPAKTGVGYDYIHTALDDHTRLAYSEIHPDEKAATCAGFLRRAAAFYAGLRITTIERLLTERLGLPQKHPVETGPRRLRRHRQTHPPLPTPDQRQSRTLQPHPR
jgi:hypothetical protein